MLRERTYIVRIYRREGARGRLAGMVEIVDEQRIVSFAGLLALGAILAKPSTGGGQGAGRRKRRLGAMQT